MKQKKGVLLYFLAAVILSMFFSMTGFAATRTISLKAGKFITDKKAKYLDTNYFKINVPKSGYLKVTSYCYDPDTPKEKYMQPIELCNSKKKSLNGTSKYCLDDNKYTVYYGVKKGTYYIKAVNQFSYYQKIKYTFHAVTEKSGSTKSKAVSISRNKTVNGLFLAGEKKTKVDYYKIRLTKSQVIQLTLKGKVEGSYYVRIIPAKSRAGKTLVWINPNPKLIDSGTDDGGYEYEVYEYEDFGSGISVLMFHSETKTLKTQTKAPKGTYYIAVSKGNGSISFGNGSYSIKWK